MSLSANEMAFLDMLAHSEGTVHIGDRGYNALVGGGTFTTGYAHHPNQLVALRNRAGQVVLKSDAAGRYQFLFATWAELKRKLSLPDFGPESQDAACMELIAGHGALASVQAGHFASAIAACNRTWASLPGSPYGQPTHSLAELLAVYKAAGGVIA